MFFGLTLFGYGLLISICEFDICTRTHHRLRISVMKRYGVRDVLVWHRVYCA